MLDCSYLSTIWSNHTFFCLLAYLYHVLRVWVTPVYVLFIISQPQLVKEVNYNRVLWYFKNLFHAFIHFPMMYWPTTILLVGNQFDSSFLGWFIIYQLAGEFNVTTLNVCSHPSVRRFISQSVTIVCWWMCFISTINFYKLLYKIKDIQGFWCLILH